MTLGSGADEIDMFYFGRGHTNGDAWVLFPALRTAHLGDLFARKGLPFFDGANGGKGLAKRTFKDTMTIGAGADRIELHYFGRAHTDGDALIHWKGANVLHMGDTFFNGMLPFIDLDSGGSIDGMIAAAGRGVEMANDQTVIIPGHGPVARRADLERYRDMLLHLRNRIGQGVARGQTLVQIQAEGHANAYGRDSDFITPAAFTEAVYRSLMREVAGIQDDHHH